MTAVELFIEQLENQGDSWENVSIGRIQISIKVEDYLELLQQAKEMEKKQIVQAYEYLTIGTSHYGEQYYNETFKNTNK